jgi:hypothetical protein
MQLDKLKDGIGGLTKMQLHIDSKGGSEENGDLFESYFNIRANVL